MIFQQGNVSAIVQTIFDAPIGARQEKQSLWGSLLSRKTGNAIDHLFLDLACFGEEETTLKFEDLFKVWPVQEIFELAAQRQGTGFNPSMTFVHALGGFEILWEISHARNRFGVRPKP